MCYVIVTSRSLIWTLLTIVCTTAMLVAVVTPHWLVGSPRKILVKEPIVLQPVEDVDISNAELEYVDVDVSSASPVVERIYRPSVGIFNRCTRIHQTRQPLRDVSRFQNSNVEVTSNFQFSCAPFVTNYLSSNADFPHCWKLSLLFLSAGLILMAATVVMAVLACCKRAVAKKSIFNISGTIQATAGMFYILGLILYPGGWGSRRVQLLCGVDAAAYILGTNCSLGWAFYTALASTAGTFICSVLSVQADISTSSDKVQDEISEGKNLICLI